MRVDIERDVLARGRDMRRDRFLQQIRRADRRAAARRSRRRRADRRLRCAARRSRSNAPAAIGFIAAARRPCAREAVQQRRRDERLADLGIGAGDEEAKRGAFMAAARSERCKRGVEPGEIVVAVRGRQRNAQARRAGGHGRRTDRGHPQARAHRARRRARASPRCRRSRAAARPCANRPAASACACSIARVRLDQRGEMRAPRVAFVARR